MVRHFILSLFIPYILVSSNLSNFYCKNLAKILSKWIITLFKLQKNSYRFNVRLHQRMILRLKNFFPDYVFYFGNSFQVHLNKFHNINIMFIILLEFFISADFVQTLFIIMKINIGNIIEIFGI